MRAHPLSTPGNCWVDFHVLCFRAASCHTFLPMTVAVDFCVQALKSSVCSSHITRGSTFQRDSQTFRISNVDAARLTSQLRSRSAARRSVRFVGLTVS